MSTRARGGPALRHRIGYLPGELRLDDRLTVDETLRSWSRLRGGPTDQTYVDALCERLAVDPSRAARTLSSGNRRKVGLVGAFMSRPDLLVLDEPTGGLDPLVCAELSTLIGEVRSDGRTVFMSSHVLSEVQRVADSVIVLRAGRVSHTTRSKTSAGRPSSPSACGSKAKCPNPSSATPTA